MLGRPLDGVSRCRLCFLITRVPPPVSRSRSSSTSRSCCGSSRGALVGRSEISAPASFVASSGSLEEARRKYMIVQYGLGHNGPPPLLPTASCVGIRHACPHKDPHRPLWVRGSSQFVAVWSVTSHFAALASGTMGVLRGHLSCSSDLEDGLITLSSQVILVILGCIVLSVLATRYHLQCKRVGG